MAIIASILLSPFRHSCYTFSHMIFTSWLLQYFMPPFSLLTLMPSHFIFFIDISTAIFTLRHWWILTLAWHWPLRHTLMPLNIYAISISLILLRYYYLPLILRIFTLLQYYYWLDCHWCFSQRCIVIDTILNWLFSCFTLRYFLLLPLSLFHSLHYIIIISFSIVYFFAGYAITFTFIIAHLFIIIGFLRSLIAITIDYSRLRRLLRYATLCHYWLSFSLACIGHWLVIFVIDYW